MTITVSTDGSALGNPNGPMGWAWADHTPHAGGRPGHEHPGDCDAGGATNGTNQIGELCAVLEALRAHPGDEPLVIETDSQYAINCSTKWVRGWKRNGWRNSQKQPVKNAELIKAIDAELSRRPGSVKFVWVKGHAGNAGNEKVDELARTYAGDCRSGARDGYLPKEGWQSLIASEYARGLDVPSDARMLLDGAIDDAAYHLGRGSGDDATGDMTKDAAAGERTEVLGRTIVLPAAKGVSLADGLAEPEGVPDYPFAPRVAGNAAVGDDPTATAVLPRKADGAAMPVTRVFPAVDTAVVDGGVRDAVIDDADAARTSDGTNATDTSGVTDVADAPDTADDTHDAPADTRATASVASGTASAPAPRSGADAGDGDAGSTAHPTAAPHAGARRRGSGLTVSGMLRFSPPPQSSPTYDGHPRFIRGTITVEGYVKGDGTIVLNDAEFNVRHA